MDQDWIVDMNKQEMIVYSYDVNGIFKKKTAYSQKNNEFGMVIQ